MKLMFWIYSLIVILFTTMINLGETGRAGAWGGGHSSGGWSSGGGHK